MKSRCHFAFATLILGSFIFTGFGCVKNDLEERENREKKIISDYVTAHNIPAESKQKSGIYYIEEVAGTGQSPEKNEYAIINYVGRYLETDEIRETSYDSLKNEWPLAERFKDYLYGPVKVQCGYSMMGINEALYMMKEGGRATVILPSNMANFDQNPLVYELQLLKVFTNPVRFEDSVLRVYVGQNYGDTAQIADTTVWYKITQNSASESVFGPNDTIYFNFTGKILDAWGNTVKDDRIFSSNAGKEPVKYRYGQAALLSGNMINANKLPAGLKIAFDSAGFKSQTKASVVMSYKVAFGERGIIDSEDNYYIMPAYANIVYDIEVVDIRQAP